MEYLINWLLVILFLAGILAFAYIYSRFQERYSSNQLVMSVALIALLAILAAWMCLVWLVMKWPGA